MIPSPIFSLVRAIGFSIVFCISQNGYAQLTYYARASGNWTTTSTWSTTSCAGATAGTTPGTTDNVVICTGRTVTYNVSSTTTIANLTIDATGVLTISSGRNLMLNSLTLNGTVNGNGGGDLRVGNIASCTISGSGFFSTTNNATQLRLLSAVTVVAGADINFNSSGRFHLNGSVLTNNGKITIGANSTLAGGGTFINNASTSTLLFSRSGNFPNGTTLAATATGNTVEFAAASNTRLMDNQGSYYHLIIGGGGIKRFRASNTTIRGNLTIRSGVTLDTNSGTRTINIAGNWINNLGGVFDENSSLVTFNGSTNNQTLSPPAGGEIFYDLTINNSFASGSVTAGGNVSITSGRTLTMTSGIFDMGTNTLGETGAANFTATGGDLQMGKVATTLPEFTGTYSVTGGTITFTGVTGQTIRSLNAAPSNYHNISMSGAGTKTLAGNITVRGNWTNSSSPTAGNFTVSFTGTGTQTITNGGGQTFFAVTVNTTGPLVQGSTTDITITNTLTMTSGNININGRTLSLGSGAGATLVRTTGTCYAGTFRRYFPVAVISSTVAPLYGLFPVGTALTYRPVQINSTVSPTTAGTVSVLHTDATTVTDVAYADNEGSNIQRVTDMRSAISTATLAGGTYTLSVSFTNLSSTGVLTDLKLENLIAPFGRGTTIATTGAVANPTGIRSLLTTAQLTNTFVIGTISKANTPLLSTYYSRRTGNWNDVTAGNSTWSLTDGGASCNCIPLSSSIVYINPTHTVTVNVAAITDFVTIRTGATLNGTANFTANYDLTTEATGRINPSNGAWTISRNMTIAGTSTSASSATIAVTSVLQIDAANTLTTTAASSVGGNLIVDGTLNIGSTTMTLSGSNASISGSAGAATINGNGTLAITTSKTIASGSTLTIQPVLAISSLTTVTNLGTVVMTGNITGADPVTSIWTNSNNSSLSTTGALLVSGVLNASAAPNTVNYNGAGVQAVKTPAASYYNLMISNAGTKTTASNIGVTNLLTIQDAAVLNMTTNTLNGVGGLTMSGTSGLFLSKTTSTTYPELSGVYTITGGTITLNQASGVHTLRAVDYYNLTLNGSGTSSYDFSNGPLNINNNFVYNSSSSNASNINRDITAGTVTITAGTLTTSGTIILEIVLAGGWTRNGGTFTPGANTTVLFSGSVNQQIGGSVATTFTDMEVSNSGSSGLSLAQDISVSGTLTFTDGNLISTSTNTLSIASGADVTGASDDSYVDGPMDKVGNADFEFPIGRGGSFRPLEIKNLSGSGTFQAEYFHADPNGAGYNTASKDVTLTRIGTGEYWVLSRTAGTPSTLVTLSWDDYSGTIDELSSLRVARWNGTTWKDHGNGGTSGSVSPGTGTIDISANTTNFGPFTLAASNTNNPLPVELLAFNAVLHNNEVLVQWTTATETNNEYFTVEKTRDAVNFTTVGKVAGAGTSHTVISYVYTDPQPYSGLSYYRIMQTDYNDKRSYSHLAVIDNRGKGENVIAEVFPNPSPGASVTISYQGLAPNENIHFDFQNANGQVLFSNASNTGAFGNFVYLLDAIRYPKGIYLFTVHYSGLSHGVKIIVN